MTSRNPWVLWFMSMSGLYTTPSTKQFCRLPPPSHPPRWQWYHLTTAGSQQQLKMSVLNSYFSFHRSQFQETTRKEKIYKLGTIWTTHHNPQSICCQHHGARHKRTPPEVLCTWWDGSEQFLFFWEGGRFWQHEYNLHNIEKVILMLWVIGVQYIHWRTYRSSLFVCFVTFKGLFVIKKGAVCEQFSYK